MASYQVNLDWVTSAYSSSAPMAFTLDTLKIVYNDYLKMFVGAGMNSIGYHLSICYSIDQGDTFKYTQLPLNLTQQSVSQTYNNIQITPFRNGFLLGTANGDNFMPLSMMTYDGSNISASSFLSNNSIANGYMSASNDTAVCVCNGTPYSLKSTDGLGWTFLPQSGTDFYSTSIAFGNGLFVGVDNQNVNAHVSQNGGNFAAFGLPVGMANTALSNIVFKLPYFIIMVNGQNWGFKSTDGQTWVKFYLPNLSGDGNWQAYSFYGIVYLLNRSSNIIIYSDNLSDWYFLESPIGTVTAIAMSDQALLLSNTGHWAKSSLSPDKGKPKPLSHSLGLSNFTRPISITRGFIT